MASSIFNIVEHTVPCQHIREYPRATLDEQEDVLHLAVKQYIPKDNKSPKRGDITIIGAHANGFPKELYEPLWVDLYHQTKKAGYKIRGIWIADAAHQNKSYVLNESKVGNDPSWVDHPRDLLQMVNHFRSDIVRPVVGIAHSMGGFQIASLALLHPRLFTSLVLMEPVIQNYFAGPENLIPARLSALRRDVWPSRAVAEASFKKIKFYQSWDRRVLDLWLEYGLRDLPTQLHSKATSKDSSPADNIKPVPATPEATNTPVSDPGVTLTTPKHQEVFTFLRPAFSRKGTSQASSENPKDLHTSGEIHNRLTHPDLLVKKLEVVPFYRPEPLVLFTNLPFIRPPVLYIYGEGSGLSPEETRSARLANTGIGVGGSGGVAAGRAKDYVFKGSGHLVPFERVGEIAIMINDWIAPELEQWRRDEADFKKQWNSLSVKEKTTLSQRWEEEMAASIPMNAPKRNEKPKL